MGRMRALGVIVCQPFSDPGVCHRSGFKCVHVNAFVFQGSPEPFYHPVVDPATFAIHGYLDVGVSQSLRSFKTGELTTLIAVRDLRLAIFCDGLFYGFNAKISFHTVRQPPG